jgi:ATP-dependent Lon protease
VCRKIAREVVTTQTSAKAAGKTKAPKIVKSIIDEARVAKLLGPPKFRDLNAAKKNEVGATTGLAWTEVGGQILTTEATVMDGRGKLTTTGKLGDVMQESAQAAMSYIRSRAQYLGIPKDFYRHLDIHIHVPEGAIPKDGPSAGITIATTLCSALTKIPVRGDIAMTGEITLRGRVLPIGGMKEKLLAAHRNGISEVILPKDNEKDLPEVPEYISKDMRLHFVDSMDEVLKLALERELEPMPLTPGASTVDVVPGHNDDKLMH